MQEANLKKLNTYIEKETSLISVEKKLGEE